MATIKPPTKAQIEASNNYKREKEILRDIHKIDVAIQNADPVEMESLHRYLDGKYQYGIADWGKSMYGYVDGHGFKYEWLGADSIKDNLSTMKPKLEAFMHGWNAKSSSAGVYGRFFKMYMYAALAQLIFQFHLKKPAKKSKI